MLNKCLALLLLITLLFNMAGIFVLFKLDQARIRREIKYQIKAGVPEDELHRFALTTAAYLELEWTKPDREFRFNGKLFDVVRSEKQDSQISLYCINDTQESALFAKLDRMVQQNQTRNSSDPNNPIHLALSLFKIIGTPLEDMDWHSTLYGQLATLNYGYQNLYRSVFEKVSTPPPLFR